MTATNTAMSKIIKFASKESDSDIFLRSAIVFFTALTCYVFIYFYELSHFTLRIDEEPMSNYYHSIANGRWGDALLKNFILPAPYIPFFTQFLSLILLSITSVILCALSKFNTKQSLIFSVMCCALPQVAFQMQYVQQVDTYAAGCLLAVLSTAFMFIQKRRFLLVVFSVFAATYAIGIYQSLVLIPITIFLFKCYVDDLKFIDFVKNSAFYFIILVITESLYTVITKLFINYYGTNDLGYFSDRINWLHAPLSEVLRLTYREISIYFTGNSIYGLEAFSLVSAFAVVGVITGILNKKYLQAFLVVCIALSPFIFNIINGGYQNPRILSSLPYCFGFMALIALRNVNTKIVVALMVFLLLVGSAKTSRLFYAEELRHEQDVAFSTRLISSIYASDPDFDQTKNRIYFYGTPNLPEPWSFNKSVDSFNWSWYNMFGGSNARITHFMQYMGFSNFNTPPYSESQKLFPDIGNMPIYPKAGSIKFFPDANILVVKLGPKEGSHY